MKNQTTYNIYFQLHSMNQDLEEITETIFMDRNTVLGKGSFAKVMRGYDSNQQLAVAIKHIPFINPTLEEKIFRECEILKNLNDLRHPNILKYYGYEKKENEFFIFLELCSKDTLKEKIESGMSEELIAQYFFQLIDAMTFMASQNILHRDLKPKNILISENNLLKIADFGCSRVKQVMMTEGIYCCTPLYSPPEFFIEHTVNYDQKCDVWSAGIILYEMFTKNHVAEQEEELCAFHQAIEEGKFPLNLPPNINQSWEKILKKMIVRDPQNRASFAEINMQLQKMSQSLQEDFEKKYGERKGSVLKTSFSNIFKTPQLFSSGHESEREKCQMMQKHSEQIQLMNKLSLYCSFILEKHQIAKTLFKRFRKDPEEKQIPYPSIYKCFLTFLSISMSLAKIQNLLQQIQNKKVFLPKEQIVNLNFSEQNIGILNACIQQAETSLVRSYSEGIETVLKICQFYFSKNKNRPVQNETKQIVDSILTFKKNKVFEAANKYEKQLKSLLNHPKVCISPDKFVFMETELLQIYGLMLLLGKSGDFLNDTNYEDPDFIKRIMDKVICSDFQTTKKQVERYFDEF